MRALLACPDAGRGALQKLKNGMTTENNSTQEIQHPAVHPQNAIAPPLQSKRPSRARMAIAFGVAAISDFLSIWTVFAPPAQWALDVITALVLFLILGRRWALLPGLIAEAIPGMGVFPVWVLVVLSIIIYDGIKRPSKTS